MQRLEKVAVNASMNGSMSTSAEASTGMMVAEAAALPLAGRGSTGRGSTGKRVSERDEHHRRMVLRLVVLATLAIGLVVVFMTIFHNGAWDYILPRRGRKVLAIVLTGGCIAYATVIFQTLTNNRILTPSIIGFDALFVLLQTMLVYFAGAARAVMIDERVSYLLSVGLMVVFAGLLYRWLFRREGRNLYLLVLVGIIFGTLFSSISSFMQLVIDPNSFDVLMDRLFASFNTVNEGLLWVSVAIVALAVAWSLRYTRYLDVLSLGRDNALSLGVDHEKVVNRLMVVVTILIAVPTALIGSITFLGLLVANLAWQVIGTYRHAYVVPAAICISVIALVGGQLIIERVFNFNLTLSAIINFLGGALFLWLLLRQSNSLK